MPKANTTLEQLRKGITRASDATHQLVLKRIPAHFLELDLGFAHNSAVLRPTPERTEDADVSATGTASPFAALASVLRYAEQNAGQKLMVIGHTDTSGATAYNRKLSDMRANNVHALLKGESHAWARSCEQRHEISDVQAILRWLSRTHGYECDPGVIDGIAGKRTTAAREQFRKHYNEEFNQKLAIKGPMSHEDWKAFFKLYERSLALALECAESELGAARQKVQFCPEPTLGCGEAWPVTSVGVDGLRSATNRRVDLVFFEEEGFPSLRQQEPPGLELYASSLRFKRSVPDGEPDAVFQFLDSTGAPVAQAGVRIRKLPDGSEQLLTTDANGVVRLPGSHGESYEFLGFAENVALVPIPSDDGVA